MWSLMEFSDHSYRRASDGYVLKSGVGHSLGVIDVSEINKNWNVDGRCKTGKVQISKFIPFCGKNDGINVVCCVVGILTWGKIREGLGGCVERFRIVGTNGAAFFQQMFGNAHGRRVAEIIGIGLEGQSEQPDGFTADSIQRGSNLINM